MRVPDSDEHGASALIGHVYRRQGGQLIATLVRLLGPGQIDLAESAVQDAFLKACERWPTDGIPDNPGGWLTTVAKNSALNRIRRQRWLVDHEAALRAWYREANGSHERLLLLGAEEATGLDDQLQMMFICCHPSLPERSQVCLTLKTVGGFSVPEIARACLSTEAATRKLITRAKQKIRETEIPFAFPPPGELPGRLANVLRVLYLIFNEGYSATDGQHLVRADLCDEAIWLTSLFLHDAFDLLPKRPATRALLALMLLQSSRIPARTDEHGSLVTLDRQDRALWDQERIALGLHYLAESATGDEVSAYHLEAEIAAYHAGASSYEAADWVHILACYDTLYALNPSPVVALNRVVALGMAVSPEAGLTHLHTLADNPRLQAYYLLPATFAELYRQVQDIPAALHYYQQAYALAATATEKRHLEQRMAACQG